MEKPFIPPGYILHDLGNGQLVLVPELLVQHSAFQVKAENAKAKKNIWRHDGKVSHLFLMLE